MYASILKFIEDCVFKYAVINGRICGAVAMQLASPWQLFCAPLVRGSSPCYSSRMNLIGPPSTELINFYLNTLRDVVTSTFDLLT